MQIQYNQERISDTKSNLVKHQRYAGIKIIAGKDKLVNQNHAA